MLRAIVSREASFLASSGQKEYSKQILGLCSSRFGCYAIAATLLWYGARHPRYRQGALELSLLTLQALRPFFPKKVEKQRERWREIGWRPLPPELRNFLTTTFGERIQLYFSGTGPDYINLLTETKAVQVRANQEAESSSSTSTPQGLTAEQALVLLKKAREGRGH